MKARKLFAGLFAGAALFAGAGGVIALDATAAHASTVLAGDTNVEGTLAQITSSDAEAFGYVAGATGTAADIVVYLESDVGANVAIYSDSEGMPHTLIASGGVSSNTANSWVTIPLSSNPTLSHGTAYWLAISPHTTSDTVNYYDNDGTGSEAWEDSGDGLPSTFQLDTPYNDGPASIYIQTA